MQEVHQSVANKATSLDSGTQTKLRETIASCVSLPHNTKAVQVAEDTFVLTKILPFLFNHLQLLLATVKRAQTPTFPHKLSVTKVANNYPHTGACGCSKATPLTAGELFLSGIILNSCTTCQGNVIATKSVAER